MTDWALGMTAAELNGFVGWWLADWERRFVASIPTALPDSGANGHASGGGGGATPAGEAPAVPTRGAVGS